MKVDVFLWPLLLAGADFLLIRPISHRIRTTDRWRLLHSYSVLVGNPGSGCSCGCCLTHQIHPNIVSDGSKPLMATTIPDGIHRSEHPVWHSLIFWGNLKSDGSLKLMVTFLILFLSSFIVWRQACPMGHGGTVHECAWSSGCAGWGQFGGFLSRKFQSGKMISTIHFSFNVVADWCIVQPTRR